MNEPEGKHIFGFVKVGEKGQIVIPKEARSIFGINPGDSLLVLGDENEGLAVIKSDFVKGALFEALSEYSKEKKSKDK